MCVRALFLGAIAASSPAVITSIQSIIDKKEEDSFDGKKLSGCGFGICCLIPAISFIWLGARVAPRHSIAWRHNRK